MAKGGRVGGAGGLGEGRRGWVAGSGEDRGALVFVEGGSVGVLGIDLKTNQVCGREE